MTRQGSADTRAQGVRRRSLAVTWMTVISMLLWTLSPGALIANAATHAPDAQGVPAVLVPSGTSAQSAAPATQNVTLLVKFKANVSKANAQASLKAAGASAVKRSHDAIATHEISVPAAAADKMIAQLKADAGVARVTRAISLSKADTTGPNDPSFKDQWALTKISWDKAYAATAITGHATLAVLDTGIDASHPDFAGKSFTGTSFVGGDALADPNGHGTALAGIAAASVNDGTGIAGVAYAGVNDVLSVQVLAADGSGSDADVVAGVIWAADNGAAVILMGFSSTDYSFALADAIKYAWDKGALVIAATGNDGSSAFSYPAGMPYVVGVGSTDQFDKVSSFSNTGSAAVNAPGESIYTDAPGATFATTSGTSAAAAHAAGLAALLRANGATNAEASSQLRAGATSGRIDVAASFTADKTMAPTAGTPNGGVADPAYTAAAIAISGTMSGTTMTWTATGLNANRVYRVRLLKPDASEWARVSCFAPSNNAGTGTFNLGGGPNGNWTLHLDQSGTNQTCPGGLFSADAATATVSVQLPPLYVTSIARWNPANVTLTSASSVSWQVTFSLPAFGVDSSDFALATTGLTGAGITGVSGSGSTYTVTASTGTGSGSIRLDLVDDDSIFSQSFPSCSPVPCLLGGSGSGNGNFTGDAFTIDKTAPAVAVTFPVQGTTYTSAAWTGALTGTSSDANGILRVDLQIEEGPNGTTFNKSFDGTSFTSGTTILTATGTTAWMYALAAGAMTSGKTYRLTATAIDKAFPANRASSVVVWVFQDAAATSLAVSPANGIYGGTADLSATLTSGAAGISGKTVAFTLNGSAVGSATTNASGVATLTGASVSGISAGTYATGIGASFAGDTSYQASSGTAQLTVGQKTLTASFTASNKQYDGTTLATIATRSLSGVVGADNVTLGTSGTATFANKNVGTAKTVTATGFALSGTAAGNYTLGTATSWTATADITQASLTVTAVADSKVYDGTVTSSVAPAITGTIFAGDTASFVQTFATRNVGTNQMLTPSGSVNDGNGGANYNVTFVASTNKDHNNGDITARPITVTAQANSKQYDRTTTAAASPLITSGTLGAGDSASFSEAYADFNVGTNKTLTPSGSVSDGNGGANYSVTFASSTNGTITARPISVKADDKSKVYGISDPALTYSVTSGSVLTGDSFSGALTRDAGENVGTYAIKQGTLTLGGNYNLSFTNGTFAIATRAVTVTADAQTKTYGNADPALTYQITSGSLAAGDSFTGALTRDAGSNVGTYAITQGTLALSSNYALTFVGANLSITARPVTVTADAQSKTYGNADPALTYQVTSGSLVAGDSFSGALTRDAGENVGTYAIKQGTLALSTNYTLTFVGANLSITARPITVTAAAKSKTYGDADPTLTYTITSGSLAGTDTLSGALTRDAGESVGSYAIKQGTLSGGANYTITFVGASLAINAKPLTITAGDRSKTYGDALVLGTTAFTTSAMVTGDSVTSVTLASSGAAATAGAGTYSIVPSAATGTGLGNYTITYANGTLTVNKRDASVTANSKSRAYGDANPAFDAVVSALVNGDTLSYTLATTADSGSVVGSYDITVTLGAGASNPNYNITATNGTLSITKATLTVGADDKSRAYGDANPTFTATFSGFKNAETLATSGVTGSASLTTTATATSNIGSYTITAAAGTLAAGNYTFTFTNGTLTVGTRAISVAADARSKTYGDADPALTYQVTSATLANGDLFTGALTRAAGESVGTYAITQGTLALSSNYALSFTGANLTVATRAVSVTADAKSKTYGDADPALTYQITSGTLASGDSFTGALTRATGENAGTYGSTQGTLALDRNYALSFTGANLTINKADPTITITPFSGVYDGNAHALSGTAAGVHGESLAGLDLGATFTNVPGGTANWTFTDVTGNYNNKSGSAAVTISKANATITVNGHTGIYDGDAHGATGTATGVKGENLSSLLNPGSSFTNVPGGTASWTFAGNANYNSDSGTAAIVLSKANASITVNGYTGIYDGDAHGATGSAKGVKNQDLSSLLNLGSSFTNVPGGTASWSFAGNDNYNSDSGTAAIVLSKADAEIHVSGFSGKHDGHPHGASGSAKGVKGEDLTALLHLGNAFSHVPGGTAHWTFDGNGNYKSAGGDVAITIAKADATISVTGYDATYNAASHTATGSVTGVSGESLVGLDLSGTTHIAAGSYTDTWTFTDVTGDYNNASGSVTDVIGKAHLTVTADAKSMNEGAVLPGFTATLSGFQGSDTTLSSTTGTAACGTATTGDDNGTFAITCTAGTLAAANYDFPLGNFVAGTLTVFNVAPTTAITGAPATSPEGTAITVGNTTTDPSAADMAAGFTFAWTVTKNGSPFASGSANAVTFTPDDNGTYVVTLTATDKDGGVGSDSRTIGVTNVAPAITGLTLTATTINENGSTTLNGTFTDPGADAPWTVAIDWGDGSATETFTTSARSFSRTHQYLDDNPTNTASDTNTVSVTVTDKDGLASSRGTTSVTVNNIDPVVTSVTSTVSGPIAVNTPFTVTATFSDVGTQDSHKCVVDWDDLTTTTTTWIGAGTTSCTVKRPTPYTIPGVYNIKVTVWDDDNGSGFKYIDQYVVVYDPNGGFVTGGGWINSPAGACTFSAVCGPNTVGRANFGFTSQYKKGSSVPTGNTEFNFSAGSFNFHSESYTVLVVSGYKAQYQGTGTINGAGNYSFILTAYDGDAQGGGGVDKFRIRIRDASGTTIYDNVRGASDDMDAAAPMAIAGGSIVIHK